MFDILDVNGQDLVSGDLVFIRTSGGFFVQVSDGNSVNLNAASKNQQAWEEFRVFKEGGQKISTGDVIGFQSTSSNRYISAMNGGGANVLAQGAAYEAWERFTVDIKKSGTPVVIQPNEPIPPKDPTGIDPATPGAEPIGPIAGTPDFGPNVLLMDPSTPGLQEKISALASKMRGAQFSDERYALLFLPGSYKLSVEIGFFTEALGLGESPRDVQITGGVWASGEWFGKNNATHNFWRGTENLTVYPTLDSGVNRWHVSQATHMRRLNIAGSSGNLGLSFRIPGQENYASGGYVSDTVVEGSVLPMNQQQWLTRNSELKSWTWDPSVNNWNLVFVGVEGTPAPTWPSNLSGTARSLEQKPVTIVASTPKIREKPFLFVDKTSKTYRVMIPSLRKDAVGTSWSKGQTVGQSLPISDFHIARADKDNSDTLNAALTAGKNLFLTPGIYRLKAPLNISRAKTVVMGIGQATLLAESGNTLINMADADGLTLSGVLLDAGPVPAPDSTLLVVGPAGSEKNTKKDTTHPTALFDVHCRVGGPLYGDSAKIKNCVTVNSNEVIIDHMWLWRADHSAKFNLDWDQANARITDYEATNGIIVNGNNVAAYGLFVEHFRGYQTLWNGNGGEVYFYQSELPYEIRDQASEWTTPSGRKGFASFKVADHVTSHKAFGLGAYSIWRYGTTSLASAFEFPEVPGVSFKHMVTAHFYSAPGASGAIESIHNGKGGRTAGQGAGSFSAD